MSTVVDKTPFYKKLSFNLLSIGLIIVLFYAAQDILVPLFFAILLASLLLPINNFMERKGVPRILAIILSLAISLIVIGTILYFLVNQIADFLDDLPTIQSRLDNLTTMLQKWVKENFSMTIRKQNQFLNDVGVKLKESGAGILQQTFVSITQALSYLVLLPIYAFLILFYRDRIKKFIIDAFKNNSEEDVRDILLTSQATSQSYIAGLMIEMVLVFALNALGFLIIGIKYALFLALVAALLNLIPYIGMLIANVFCMFITLISCDVMNLSDVLWVGVALAAVQFVDNNFLMPLIVGSKVRINSLATIVGVLVGGALCGVAGMFLSIPGLAVLKVIFDRTDELKPYGYLLGDDSESRKAKKSVSKK